MKDYSRQAGKGLVRFIIFNMYARWRTREGRQDRPFSLASLADCVALLSSSLQFASALTARDCQNIRGRKCAMPYKPKKPCAYPNCPELTHDRFCEKHKQRRNTTVTGGMSGQRSFITVWHGAR